MKDLNKKVIEKYAYVKNGVIFEIKSYDNGDACAVAINDETTPYVTVNNAKLYFNDYIEDGDTYTISNGFKKTIHSENEELDKEVTYQNYYRTLCEEVIANTIISNYSLEYSDFVSDLSCFGIPTWMFVQDPNHSTVEGIDKIDFTETYYNSLKEDKIKDLIFESASNTANKYGYKLTLPSKAEDLEIAKIN